MTSAFIRKARQLIEDPVLRHWLVRRVARLEKAPAAFITGAPPYLTPGATLSEMPRTARWISEECGSVLRGAEGTTTIDLPGASVKLSADNPGALFDREYADLETSLAAHRFAWLPLAGPDADPGWVRAIWEAWIGKYEADRTGWPWHAYTTAERAINIIDFASRFGLPGNREDTVQLLFRHGETIRRNLEYFGEHYTSNHLSNNGRGLLRIGIALGVDEFATDGAQIMIAEAGRIFGRSGILNEGSSHYHLLITRNYIDAWLAAEQGGMEEARVLGDIAESAVAVIPGLCLPGGMPMIGDISPDAPPRYFDALTNYESEGSSWPAMLDETSREMVSAMVDRVAPISPDRLAEDGWHRFEADEWHALAYVPPDGWPPMPGHGHEDLGSFELHDGKTPVVVDPGRGTYTDREYTRADVHSGLTIDGHGPAPVNRPYYDDGFRRRIVPQAPVFERKRSGRLLRSHGYSRLSGIGAVEREWRMEERKLTILDRVEGRGKRQIARSYFTDADVEVGENDVTLSAGSRKWRLSADTRPAVKAASKWTAYGDGGPGKVIAFESTETLPFDGRTVLERL